MARLKVIQTGHGFGGNEDNCCEFCQKKAFVKVDEKEIYSRYVWRICSDNPLYPQGGTWLFNRSNWCPGAEVQPFDFELTSYISQKSSIWVDYDMEYYDKPYSSGNNTPGNWLITAYVITYGDLNYKLDAEITDIIAPSTKDIYLRLNPTTTSPIIVIRNRGSEQIKEIKIKYGIVGVNQYEYKWNGVLDSFESDTVVLPSINCCDWDSDSNLFRAEIINVNNQNDEYTINNVAYSRFNTPPSFYQNLKIMLRTNNYNVLTNDPDFRPYSYQILDSQGKIIFSRNDFLPSSIYIDTIMLKEGCYEFKFFNLFECGLGFWFYNRFFNLNTGSLQLLSDDLVHFNPQPDFGASIFVNFRTAEQQTLIYNPDTLNFASVKVNDKATKDIIIKPKNEKGLTLWDFKIILGDKRGFFIDNITPQPNSNQQWILKEKDSVLVTVSFAPRKSGNSATSLSFFTSDLKNQLASIPLIGMGDDGSFVFEEDFDIDLLAQKNNVYEFILNKETIKPVNLKIYNILGQILLHLQDIGNHRRLDLNRFDTGIYFLYLSNGSYIRTYPLILLKK